MLDSSLGVARPQLESAGIEIVDESAASYYGGKNLYLFWGVRLVASSSGPYEDVARVTVRLGYREPVSVTEHNPVEMMTVAEIFQLGQRPRFCEAKNTNIERNQLGKSDFASMVLKEIEWGKLRIAGQDSSKIIRSW